MKSTQHTYGDLANAMLLPERCIGLLEHATLQETLDLLKPEDCTVVCLIDMAHSLRSIDASLKKLVRQGNEPEVL